MIWRLICSFSLSLFSLSFLSLPLSRERRSIVSRSSQSDRSASAQSRAIVRFQPPPLAATGFEAIAVWIKGGLVRAWQRTPTGLVWSKPLSLRATLGGIPSAGRATSLQNNLVAVSPSFSMVSAFRSKILTTDSPAPPSGTAPVVGGGVDICGDVSAFDCVVGERGIDESISVTFGRVLR